MCPDIDINTSRPSFGGFWSCKLNPGGGLELEASGRRGSSVEMNDNTVQNRWVVERLKVWYFLSKAEDRLIIDGEWTAWKKENGREKCNIAMKGQFQGYSRLFPFHSVISLRLKSAQLYVVEVLPFGAFSYPEDLVKDSMQSVASVG